MLLILLQILAGWYVADAVGGLFHWYIDNSDEKTSLIPHMVRDFQSHHEDPGLMLKTGLLRLSLEPMIASLLTYGMAFVCWPAFFIALGFGGGLTQVSHYYSHIQRPPVVVRGLQALRLFNPPEGHGLHHADFDRDFCILCGWADPLVNRIVRILRGKS